MPAFKCGLCGEVIDVEGSSLTVKCPCCGAVQVVLRDGVDTSVRGGRDEVRSGAVLAPLNKKFVLTMSIVVLSAVGILSYFGGGQWLTGAGPNVKSGGVWTQASREDYEEAAAAGDAEAQFALGEMYSKGDGVDRDVRKAAEWYRHAAEQGHTEAQSRMGNAYYNGWGVAKDYKEALKWYRLAATRDDAEAQTAIGLMYHHGLGVVMSYSNAAWWYAQAAGQGYAWAQYYLGNMYRSGLGVDKNLEKARSLYQKAAEQGHIAAINALEHIRKLQ